MLRFKNCLIISWIQILFYIILSILPYRFPKSVTGEFNAKRLLVKNVMTTGPSTEIIRGEDDLRTSLGIQDCTSYGIEFEKGFPGDELGYPVYLYTEYIIEVEAVGVTDSTHHWANIPVFRLKSVKPLSYIPIYKSDMKWYLVLSLFEFLLIPTAIVLTVIYLVKVYFNKSRVQKWDN